MEQQFTIKPKGSDTGTFFCEPCYKTEALPDCTSLLTIKTHSNFDSENLTVAFQRESAWCCCRKRNLKVRSYVFSSCKHLSFKEDLKGP